jgi:Protein of unknown function (DUF1553)/Protein of unknown function (DUF1549)/Planctomycete cytochrome C
MMCRLGWMCLMAFSLHSAINTAIAADAPMPAVIEFNRDVRPILAESCYACHGPDAHKREAKLRLDTEAGLFGKGATTKPVVAGKLAESELIKRVTSTAPEQQMPPVDSGKTLSPRDIAVLKKWVEQGAAWQGHWAYLKPFRSPVPNVREAGFTRNDIDRFVLARLETAGLKHAPEADRVTLIRRLSFDLTGLPPTPEQVDQFVADSTPDAYERLVARLLDSPHYGERMAMYWLDLVRFADTAGYHSDNPRDIAPFRDYVIQAFNENKPFDKFTVEQLAGDLLPSPTVQQKVASGYNRLLQTTEEGGAQAKEYIAKYAADRVRNVSSVWLGTTMGCCECHDHKFDPFTQRDFYSMAAFFADVQEAAVGRREPGIPVPTAEDEKELARFDTEIAAARKRLDDAVAALIATDPNAGAELGADAAWQVLDPAEIKVHGETSLQKQDDGSLKSVGKVAAQETYVFTFGSSPVSPKTDSGTSSQPVPHAGLGETRLPLTGLRIEALADDGLPAKGPGLAPNGNFVLTEIKVTRFGENDKTMPVKVTRGVADHSQNGHDIATAFDGKDNTGWAVLPQIGQSHEAVFELAEPVGPGRFTIALEFKSQYPQHGIGRLRVSGTAVDKPASHWVTPALRTALTKAADQRSDAEKSQVVAFLRDQSARFQPQRDEIQKLNNDRDAFAKRIPASLVTVSATPRKVRMLPRGNWLDDSGEPVQPAVPASLGRVDTGDKRATRLDLAHWMVSADNPLPARVFVNRLWKLLYGQGLSKSLEDLGSQSEWPTHPELLDWLAVEFRESGWDVKHLVKLMVTSGTYRQSSVQSKEARAVDPFNRLLSAQNRSRLDAEFIRDNALAISGLLSPRIGGESDKPYQPEGYWEFLNFPRRTWEHDKGERQYRRGMYTWWQRSFLHPSLAAFDAPSREECTADRPRSNTPQQALTLLNDPSYVEAARVFATKILKEGGDSDEARLTWAYRRAVSRAPKPAEMAVLRKLLAKHREEFRANPTHADQLPRTGDAPLPENLDKPDLAAWTSVARTILNLHETITRL